MKMNNKLIASIVGITILLVAFAIVSLADPINPPSTKTAAGGTQVETINPGEDGVVSYALIKSGNKDLIISFTAEAILYTKTGIKGKSGPANKDTSKAQSTLQVCAYVDEEPAFPECVTFAERIQTMDGHLNESQWINLTLHTTNANAFNFIATNISKNPNENYQQQTHNVTIVAKIKSKDSSDPESVAWGAIGNRTLIVNEAFLKGEGNFNVIS